MDRKKDHRVPRGGREDADGVYSDQAGTARPPTGTYVDCCVLVCSGMLLSYGLRSDAAATAVRAIKAMRRCYRVKFFGAVLRVALTRLGVWDCSPVWGTNYLELE